MALNLLGQRDEFSFQVQLQVADCTAFGMFWQSCLEKESCEIFQKMSPHLPSQEVWILHYILQESYSLRLLIQELKLWKLVQF